MGKKIKGFECSPSFAAMVDSNNPLLTLIAAFRTRNILIDKEKGTLTTNKRTIDVKNIDRMDWLGRTYLRFETKDGQKFGVNIFDKADHKFVLQILQEINPGIIVSHD